MSVIVICKMCVNLNTWTLEIGIVLFVWLCFAIQIGERYFGIVLIIRQCSNNQHPESGSGWRMLEFLNCQSWGHSSAVVPYAKRNIWLVTLIHHHRNLLSNAFFVGCGGTVPVLTSFLKKNLGIQSVLQTITILCWMQPSNHVPIPNNMRHHGGICCWVTCPSHLDPPLLRHRHHHHLHRVQSQLLCWRGLDHLRAGTVRYGIPNTQVKVGVIRSDMIWINKSELDLKS